MEVKMANDTSSPLGKLQETFPQRELIESQQSEQALQTIPVYILPGPDRSFARRKSEINNFLGRMRVHLYDSSYAYYFIRPRIWICQAKILTYPPTHG